MSTDAETRHVVVDNRFGHVYTSSNGQLVVDQHSDDDKHLRAPATRSDQPMYDCRFYLRDVIPKEWHGRRGHLTVTRSVRDGEVVSVQMVFTPEG